MLQKYKAVVFDFDDTLVDTIGPKSKQHKHLAKEFYNRELPDEILRKHYGIPFDDLLVTLHGEDDSLENLKKNYWSLTTRFLKTLKKDAVEVVTELIKRKFVVGIITATSRQSMDFDLPRLGFPVGQISFVQTADDTPVHKPDPRVFDPAIRKLSGLKVSLNEWVYIGDAERDCLAARDAGVDFIGVTHGLSTQEHFKSWRVPFVDRLVDLL